MRAESAGYNYTASLEAVIEHVVASCPAFGHVRPECLLPTLTQSRAGGCHGIYATIRSLRFAGGASELQRGGQTYRWPRLTYEGREILYVIDFMMPRFANLPLRNKLTTIFHELYHISPRCDGDLRRFPGKNYAHGSSREAYNARLQPWIDHYLANEDAAGVTAFLELNFADLEARHTIVVGRKIRPIRPVRVR